MKQIKLPSRYNYIGAFLTYNCTLKCDYCLNKYSTYQDSTHMHWTRWVHALSRIKTDRELPITLQGGEPTQFPNFYSIVHALYKKGKYLDLLTNGEFNVHTFMNKISPMVFNRKAKYASIRFSLHANTDEGKLVQTVGLMARKGYSVGIWGLDCDEMAIKNEKVKGICAWLGLDFRLKEYLGHSRGTYKYPEGLSGRSENVLCTSTELLVSPNGKVHRCHGDLYANVNPLCHILDRDICFPNRVSCGHFGKCNPCDIKLKFNRFQTPGHSSVVIERKGLS